MSRCIVRMLLSDSNVCILCVYIYIYIIACMYVCMYVCMLYCHIVIVRPPAP